MATSTPFFNITMTGVKEAESFLAQQIKRIQDVTPALHAIAKDFYETERSWLQSEGGGRWRVLSPGYAAWKGRRYPGRPILQRSRKMYREFTGQTSNYSITGRGKLVIKQSGVDYWLKHEQGDPSTRLPRREVLSPYLLQRQQVWHDIMTEYLTVQLFGGGAASKNFSGLLKGLGKR